MPEAEQHSEQEHLRKKWRNNYAKFFQMDDIYQKVIGRFANPYSLLTDPNAEKNSIKICVLLRKKAKTEFKKTHDVFMELL